MSSRGPMTYDFIRKVIKEEGTRAGDPKMHPHALRHFYATYAIRLGMDMREVQIAVGHRDIRSTQRYTHPLMEEVAGHSSSAFENHFRKRDKNMEIHDKNTKSWEIRESDRCGVRDLNPPY